MFERRRFFKKVALMVASVSGAVTAKGDNEDQPSFYKDCAYEDLARMYLPILKQMTGPEIIGWVDHIIVSGGKIPASEARKIKTPGSLADHDKSNEIIKALNKHFSFKMNLDRHILWMIVVLGIETFHET